MSKSVEQLIQALTMELEIFEEYLEVAKQKKTIIIKGEIKELAAITNREQSIIIHLGKMDQLRTTIIGNILLEQNIGSIETITELANHLDEASKKKILDLKDKFTLILNEIKDVNELNSSLLEQSLEYVNFNLNLIKNLEPKSSSYGNKADEKEIGMKTNFFDFKV